MAWFSRSRDEVEGERWRVTASILADVARNMAAMERRLSRLDDYGREGPDPQGVIARLTRERNDARDERDKAIADAAKLMLRIHSPADRAAPVATEH